MSKKASLGEAVLEFSGDDTKLKKDTSNAKLNVEKTLSVIGGGMKAVGVGILATGAGVATVGAGIFAMAKKAASGADEILAMATTYSLTTDKIQEMKYAAELVDVPLETMVGSFSRLTMAMGSAKDPASQQRAIFDELGVSVEGVDGKLRSTNEVWLDTIDALGKIDNQAERDKISLSLFGRSAADLNPLIIAGSAALEKFGIEAHNSGAVVDEELLVAAGKLDDALQRVKSTIGAVVMKLGAQFAPGVEAVVNVVGDYLTRFSNLISDNGLSTEEKLQAASTMIAQIVIEIRDGLPKLIESGLGILRSLIQGILMAIPVVIPTLVDVVLAIVDFLVQMLPMLVEGAIQIVVALALGIAQAVPKLIPTIVQLVIDLVQMIFENIPTILDAGLKIVLGLVQGIVGAIPVLMESIPSLIESIVDATIDSLPMIILAAVEIVLALVFGILENIPLIVATIPKIIDAMIKKFSSPEFKNEMSKMGKGLVDGLKAGWTESWENFKRKITENFKQMIKETKKMLGIASPSTLFAGIGDNLMAGLAVGIDRSAELPAMASSQAMGRVTQSSVQNTYYLSGNYQYQSPSTLMDQVRMLNLLGGA